MNKWRKTKKTMFWSAVAAVLVIFTMVYFVMRAKQALTDEEKR